MPHIECLYKNSTIGNYVSNDDYPL